MCVCVNVCVGPCIHCLLPGTTTTTTGNTKNNDRGRLSVAAGPPRVLVPPAPPVAVAVVADPPILVLPPKAAQHRASMSSNRCQVSVTSSNTTGGGGGVVRLNKFVRRLYDMLEAERASGIVEWRRGLLILQNTHVFAKQILPKYFNTRNFKTFRRQLNYYGFVHVRSFNNTNSHSAPGGGGGEYSASSSSTSALWVNRELAARCAAMECSDDDSFVDDARVAKNSSRSSNSSTTTSGIASVLLLKRVEPCEAGKTVEGRRVRKELARNTVADDLGVLSVDSILPWSEMAQGSFLPGYLSQLKTTTKTNSTVGKKNINHCRPFDMCYPSSTARTVLLEHHNYNTSTSSSLISGLSSGYPIEISRQSSSNSSRIGDDSGSDEEGTPPLSSQQQMTLSSSTSVANLLLLLSKVS